MLNENLFKFTTKDNFYWHLIFLILARVFTVPILFFEKPEHSVDRLWDLMTPFQNKWFYSPEFYGSYSIKYVLPAMDKSLSCKDLEIRKGDQAIAGFLKFIEETDK